MPPVNKVSLLIKLSALVVKAVCDFVPNNPANGSVVHVLGPVAREEDSLEDASRELDGVLERRVERIDDSWTSMSYPVSLVHLFPQFAEGVVGAKHRHVECIAEVGVGTQFQTSIEILQLGHLKELRGVANMLHHPLRLYSVRLENDIDGFTNYWMSYLACLLVSSSIQSTSSRSRSNCRLWEIHVIAR